MSSITCYAKLNFSVSDLSSLCHAAKCLKYYDKNSVNCIYVASRKAIRKIWKIPNINDSNYIDSILERRCIRFSYNIFNSENQLYSSMIKYSYTNCDSTMCENFRYLINKSKFDMHQWNKHSYYGTIQY